MDARDRPESDLSGRLHVSAGRAGWWYLATALDKVYVLERQSLQLLTSFCDGGRQPGQLFGAHTIATDSKGNVYTTETYEGKRLQRFLYKGLGPVQKANQGVVWLSSRQTASQGMPSSS